MIVVGARAYYLDTMGEKGKNDRGVSDDAIFLVTPNLFAAFNTNTDPSAIYRSGLSRLKPSAYCAHRFDAHNGKYLALCQRAGQVIVHRDGTDTIKDGTVHEDYGHYLGNGDWQGDFGINIHKGGYGITSSLGCQTIRPMISGTPSSPSQPARPSGSTATPGARPQSHTSSWKHEYGQQHFGSYLLGEPIGPVMKSISRPKLGANRKRRVKFPISISRFPSGHTAWPIRWLLN